MIKTIKQTCAGLVNGEMDFEGQKLATRVMIPSMLGSCIVATIAGSCTGSFELMMKIVTGAALLVGLVCVPSWPMYRRNLLEWRSANNASELLVEENHSGETSGEEDSDQNDTTE